MISLFFIAFGYFALLPMTSDPPQVAMSSEFISILAAIFWRFQVEFQCHSELVKITFYADTCDGVVSLIWAFASLLLER